MSKLKLITGILIVSSPLIVSFILLALRSGFLKTFTIFGAISFTFLFMIYGIYLIMEGSDELQKRKDLAERKTQK